jgi:hypothetical protein
MPCFDQGHNHQWPTSGEHELVIEACETKCGWCIYKIDRKGAANNLRKVSTKYPLFCVSRSPIACVLCTGTGKLTDFVSTQNVTLLAISR